MTPDKNAQRLHLEILLFRYIATDRCMRNLFHLTAAAFQHNARTHSGPPSTGASHYQFSSVQFSSELNTITMDGLLCHSLPSAPARTATLCCAKFDSFHSIKFGLRQVSSAAGRQQKSGDGEEMRLGWSACSAGRDLVLTLVLIVLGQQGADGRAGRRHSKLAPKQT